MRKTAQVKFFSMLVICLVNDCVVKILSRCFYDRDTLCVAEDLLGKTFKFFDYYGVITEVEAYIGQDDLSQKPIITLI